MQPQLPSGKAIAFKPLLEEWNYYSLEDGNVLGVRVVVTKVIKTEQTEPTGLPVYVFQSTNVVQVLSEEEYRKVVRFGK